MKRVVLGEVTPNYTRGSSTISGIGGDLESFSGVTILNGPPVLMPFLTTKVSG